jgi:hypothetical protein
MAEFREASRRAGTAAPAQCLIVGLLAAIAGLLAGALALSPSPVAGQTASAGASQPVEGVFAVAGQLARDTYGLYLVDLRNATICLYECAGSERRLVLRSSRTFVYDRQLDSYKTEPAPAKIAELVSKARRLKDVEKDKQP